MPAENTVTRPWQKTIDFVDGLKGKLPDKELAVIKRYVEKRSREAAQTQVTVTPVNTVQHCSPCPLDPEPSSSVHVKLESSEGKMGPELKELESPSAGTGLETSGQRFPPNEGTQEQGRTTASGFLTAGVGSSQRKKNRHPRNAWTREPVTKARELRQTSPSCSRATNPETKTTSSSTPVEKERRHRLGTRL